MTVLYLALNGAEAGTQAPQFDTLEECADYLLHGQDEAHCRTVLEVTTGDGPTFVIDVTGEVIELMFARWIDAAMPLWVHPLIKDRVEEAEAECRADRDETWRQRLAHQREAL